MLESEAGEEELKALQEQIAQGEAAVKKCEEEATELEKVVVEQREIFDAGKAIDRQRERRERESERDSSWSSSWMLVVRDRSACRCSCNA